MSLRNKIIGTASALVLAGFIASPAFATDFDGLLGVDYSHLSLNHGGGDANAYGVSGTGMFGLGSQFAVQADGGYHHLDLSHGGGNQNDWDINGTAFWTGAAGRVGAVVGYDSTDGGGANDHSTSYGAFGEWYATRSITFGVKGGGFSGNSNADGDYAGAALTGYVTPDFSLQGGYDYAHVNHFGSENDWSARAEWLISENTPIAVYGAYTNSKLSDGGPTINVFSIGLTYFCDPTGPETLVAHQRTGAEEWGNTFDPVGLR